MTTAERDLASTFDAIPPESVIADPVRDHDLDAERFRAGFDDAVRRLAGLPDAWARNLAETTLAAVHVDDDASYARGYRAGLYGFLRHDLRS